jgi:hypothetical protein
MKFLNFSIILMDGSNKRITTEYKADDNEIFKEILQKLFQKYNIALNFDTLLIKDVESMNIDPAFWSQKVSDITQLYGILFVIEVYPQAVKQLSEESDEEAEENMPQEDTIDIVFSKHPSPPPPGGAPAMLPRSIQAPSMASGAPSPPSPSFAGVEKLPGGSLPSPPTVKGREISSDAASPSIPKMEKSEESKSQPSPKRSIDFTEKKKAFSSDELMSKEFSKSEISQPVEASNAKGPQEYDKNLAVEYYDRMNPEQNYILKLNISDLKLADVDTRENLLTGERITQKKDKLRILLEDPNVLVRPLFPGCLVTPTEQWTNFDSVEDELIFHITPLVKTEINGTIDFMSKNKIVYRMHLPAKVDDPRYAKTVVAYGTGISLLPKILPWFGLDVGESLELADVMPFLGGLLGSMAVNNFVAILGILLFLIVGIVVFMKKQAKFTKKQFSLADIAAYQKSVRREKQS